MKIVLTFALSGLLTLTLVPLSAAYADERLLEREGLEIYFEEAFAYSLRQTNPNDYVGSMSKLGATRRVLQNLYVYKRVVNLMEAADAISATEKQYLIDDAYRRKLLARYLEKMIAERVSTVDWEGLAKAEYAQRKAEFIYPEEVRVEHLLVSMEDVPFEAFVEKVREVQEQISTDGDFSDLVARYSDDPSAEKNGGDLGFFSYRRMQPSFSEAAFALREPGEIVGPVMTRFGAHFIRFIERRDERPLTFAEVKARLIEEVKKGTEARLREELLAEIRDEIEDEVANIDESILLGKFLRAYEAKKDAGSN